VAIANPLSSYPALPTAVAPTSGTLVDTNGLLWRVGGGAERVITMNTDEVTTQVMLAAKRAAARAVWTYMRLKPVGVVGCHVRLEIVSTSKGYGTLSVAAQTCST
jgi:hypothetical protein